MRKFLPALCIAAFLVSCSQVDSAKKDLSIPAVPTTVETAKATLKNKSYGVEEIGTIDLFHEYDWSASADTTAFIRDYLTERKAFTLRFVNDTAVNVSDDKKLIEATYDLKKDTGTALLLDIHYFDSSFSFNPGEPTRMTYNYKLLGISNENLLLETPRKLNQRKLVLLMKSK